MKEIPMISVIMSVYNGEKYLRTAVDSILGQTFTNFEFIIIEDNSSDNTLQILEKYQIRDPRIKIIKKEKNTGIAGFIENLNIGLNQAKGKYIARMDADDISQLDRFEKQINFLEKNPKIFIVGSFVQFINENDEDTKLMTCYINDRDIQKLMFKKIQLFHPVIMFRNNSEVQYLEKMFYCEDFDLYLRLMTSGYKFANIAEPLLKYRILADSISRRDNKFIKWLFVEKARKFYIQRKITDKDNYENLNPRNLLSILAPEHKNNKEELLFASRVAWKYNCRKELKQILQKGKKQYPLERKFTIYEIYFLLPKFTLPFLTKLFS